VSPTRHILVFLFITGIFPPVLAAPEWRTTHFGTCFSDDTLMQAEGSWWYVEPRGRESSIKYGGSYITRSEQISTRQYRSRKPETYYNVTGMRIKTADGTWVDKLFLPVEYFDEICGSL